MTIDSEIAVEKIITVVERYLRKRPDNDLFDQIGRQRMRDHLLMFVNNEKPLLFILPAFPMKSPSFEKVLGVLPDFGEELSLLHLEGFCQSLDKVYAHGVQLIIVSDGITYEDMLGVPPKIVLPYNQAMRDMVSELGLRHLSFERVSSMLKRIGITVDPYNPEDVQNALWSFIPEDYSIDKVLASDENIVRVYRGFIKFLTKDLACKKPETMSNTAWKKKLEAMGKEMIWRGECFSRVISLAFPDAIRLSCHGHDNRGPKYAITIMSRVETLKTPWHNVIVEDLNGDKRLIHHDEIDKSKYQLVRGPNNQPWFYRQVDERLQHKDVELQSLFPFGLLIKAVKSVQLSDLPLESIADLAFDHSLLVFRGFEAVSDQDEFRLLARRIGQIQHWVFGDILKVKESQNIDLNNVLTREAMPMHFDGTFKLKEGPNGEPISNAPHFQFFYCQHNGEKADGLTLFSETSNIVEKMPHLDGLQCSVFTPENESFGGTGLQFDLVQQHEFTGKKIIRFHEPWDRPDLQTQPTFVEIVGKGKEESDNLCNQITLELYSPENCYKHKWVESDFVLADNIALMHSRTSFTDGTRELWRIHINKQ